MSIAVFLADDHRLVREGLCALLANVEDIKVVGESADGREAVSQVKKLKPNVVLMDIAMPLLNGIEATRQIREVSPSSRVIILSMYSTSEHIYRSFEAGASGYLLKEAAGADVVGAIRAVYSGRKYLSDKVTEGILSDYISKHALIGAESPLSRLTERERQILQLVVEGKSSGQIGADLFLSPKTVETYRSRLMQKLGISDLPTLVKFAIQHGLTTLE